MQALPHRPQLRSLKSRSVQWPSQQAGREPIQVVPQLPQLLVVFRSVQVPLQQPWPAPQPCPQLPQWFPSLLRLTQVPLPQLPLPAGQQTPLELAEPLGQQSPPEASKPLLQTNPHTAPAQVGDPFAGAGQAFPQAPQWLEEVRRSVQRPAQQSWPAPQVVPQAPQWLVVVSGAQAPAQQPSPAGQAVPQLPQSVAVFRGVQTPPQQSSPAWQAFPQLPQWLVVVSGTQLPLQQSWPPAQGAPQAPQLRIVSSGVHTPLQQPWPPAQTVPQAPQFDVVLSGVQTPLQQPSPAAQGAPQAPQLSAAFEKSFHFTETKRLQFRVEGFNLTNTPIRGGVNTDFNSADFGKLPKTQLNFPRFFQIAGKFYF